ncbi:hypothetical protein, partial [Corallococcus praedator]|uniref:hypothetical protein n=1 Tax=Corallococcus praedator TaxID=2316724 RepID=UPI001315920C
VDLLTTLHQRRCLKLKLIKANELRSRLPQMVDRAGNITRFAENLLNFSALLGDRVELHLRLLLLRLKVATALGLLLLKLLPLSLSGLMLARSNGLGFFLHLQLLKLSVGCGDRVLLVQNCGQGLLLPRGGTEFFLQTLRV